MTIPCYKTFIGIVICCIAGTSQGIAQESAAAEVNIYTLSLEDGLPHREVRSTVLDTNGMMWMETAAGLIRYDGYTFNTFNQLDCSMAGKLTLGQDGLIYAVVGQAGNLLEVFNPYALVTQAFRLSDTTDHSFNGHFQARSSPFYWMAGRRIQTFSSFPSSRAMGTKPTLISSVASHRTVHQLPSPADLKDRLLFASEEAYLIHQPEKHQITAFRRGKVTQIALPTAARPRELKADSRGHLYYLTGSGVFCRKPGGSEFTRMLPDIIREASYNYLEEDQQGNLLVGHLTPFLKRFDRLLLVTPDTVTSLAWLLKEENRIISIDGDDFRRGLNMSTFGGLQGVRFSKDVPTRFTRYMYDPGVKKSKFGHVMRGFTADAQGNVYINKDSRTNAWYRLRPGSQVVDTLEIRDTTGVQIDQYGCGTNMVNAEGLIYGHSCYLWPDSVRAHLYRYNPTTEKWRVFYLPEEGQIIRYILHDDTARQLWLFTQSHSRNGKGRIYQFNLATSHFRPVPIQGPETGFVNGPRDALFDPKKENIWVATTGGLYRYSLQDQSLNRFDLEDGSSLPATEVLYSKSGKLLIGTLSMGIYELDTETSEFTRRGGVLEPGELPQSDGFIFLPSNDIAAMAITKNQQLLITTFNGLVIHDEGKEYEYTVEDGLTNNEFNTSSLYYDEGADRWYAGGVNGFVSFNADELIPELSPYQPIVVRYRTLDEEIGFEKSYHLPNGEGVSVTIAPTVAYFSLDYSLPDYFSEGQRTFATRLSGFDLGWRPPETTPTVRYTRLPPGDYQFHLRAVDTDGRSTREMPPLKITVLKPWYQQSWFYLTMILLAIGIVFTIVWARFHSLRKSFQTKQHVHELELRTLRQQMNPHFISNAMNAIREFIFAEEPERAAGYLTDFSRLMRLFLEASRSPATTISDERNLLEHYIRLEQLRFPGKFDYRIEIDKEIEPDMEEIPSFLLQPIVENAINHGLLPLQSGGMLVISFFIDPDDKETIIARVSDNGVGRRRSAAEDDTGKHVSRSTQILQDRQSLLTEDEHLRFTMNISDLDPGNENCGTVVTFTIAAGSAA